VASRIGAVEIEKRNSKARLPESSLCKKYKSHLLMKSIYEHGEGILFGEWHPPARHERKILS
jgi:hypothetical protein